MADEAKCGMFAVEYVGKGAKIERGALLEVLVLLLDFRTRPRMDGLEAKHANDGRWIQGALVFACISGEQGRSARRVRVVPGALTCDPGRPFATLAKPTERCGQ